MISGSLSPETPELVTVHSHSLSIIVNERWEKSRVCLAFPVLLFDFNVNNVQPPLCWAQKPVIIIGGGLTDLVDICNKYLVVKPSLTSKFAIIQVFMMWTCITSAFCFRSKLANLKLWDEIIIFILCKTASDGIQFDCIYFYGTYLSLEGLHWFITRTVAFVLFYSHVTSSHFIG